MISEAVECGKIVGVEHYVGYVSDFYTAVLLCSAGQVNLTYNCKTGKLIVHEWYLLPEDDLGWIMEELRDYFEQM